MDSKEQGHEALVELMERTEEPTPEFIKKLPPDQLLDLRDYTRNVVSYATSGMDELFHTISLVIKFIPNFVLLPLITKFIKAPIAGGVCAKLSVKEAVNIGNSLPVEYLGEVALYVESEQAAMILEGLKPKLAEFCIIYEAEHHPVKALDIGQYVSDRILKVAARYMDFLEQVDPVLLKDYEDVLDKIKKFT